MAQDEQAPRGPEYRCRISDTTCTIWVLLVAGNPNIFEISKWHGACKFVFKREEEI